MSLGEEKTISVTTFRKSGDGVATPTWVVPLPDGRIGFWTSSKSGKAKRLRNNPRVTVVPCNTAERLPTVRRRSPGPLSW
ncbi:pyridoxamine 5'-phosphate oxidase family protein [Rhodococcus qingshengii]|uniref:pyridoxamine 5'-phosphate oxidase family protein n=1 Tax=Rhodococcus TaxID=1827 RepID=UPI002016830A|nr:pyridoxamine 5'-phosphate oxidase family protein [Rhodococcus qingshengii]